MERFFIGYIEKRRSFYNFVASFVYEDGRIVDIFDSSVRSFFYPDISPVIYLEYAPRKGYSNSKSYNFINRIVKGTDDNYFKGLFAMRVVESDMEEYGISGVKYKISLEDVVGLDDYIFDIGKLGFSQIVTPKIPFTYDNLNSNQIIVNGDFCFLGDKVLLANEGEDKYYGRFTLQYREYNNDTFVKPNAEEKSYQLPFYSEIQVINIPIYSDKYWDNNEVCEYISVAYISESTLLSYEDTMTDDLLLGEYRKLISEDYFDFDKLIHLSRDIDSSLLLSEKVNETIREKRAARVGNLLSKIENYNSQTKETAGTLLRLFLEKSDEDTNSIVLSTGRFVLQGDNDSHFDTEDKNFETQVDLLSQELSQIRDEYASQNAVLMEAQSELEESNRLLALREEDIERLQLEINKLHSGNEKFSQYQTLEDAIDNLNDQIHGLHEEKGGLNADIARLRIEIKNLIEEKDRLNQDLESAQNELNNIVSNAVGDASKKVFSSYFSQKMMKAAEELYASEQEQHYTEQIGRTLEATPIKPGLVKKELVTELYNRIKIYRPNYSVNDIINMLICVFQNFLVVFSGEPGTGKTSICHILAHCLGIDGDDSRFIHVAVERGWSSKRDLIGYYNPLTRKYDKSNGKIYDGLMLLNAENNNSKYPFLILLDEANLSPMEYYWSDFIKVTDRTSNHTTINIGTESDIFIPETLHFLATINNDQTTERLSPRLIDRAWIISLPQVYSDSVSPLIDEEHPLDRILWQDIQDTFVLCIGEHNKILLEKALNRIYALFEENNFPVSTRVRTSIRNYILIAQEYMEEDNGVKPEERALDFAIVQKLLPKISGHISTLQPLFDGIKSVWSDDKITPYRLHADESLTIKAIKKMEEIQKNNMGYCQFLG